MSKAKYEADWSALQTFTALNSIYFHYYYISKVTPSGFSGTAWKGRTFFLHNKNVILRGGLIFCRDDIFILYCNKKFIGKLSRKKIEVWKLWEVYLDLWKTLKGFLHERSEWLKAVCYYCVKADAPKSFTIFTGKHLRTPIL